MVVRKYSGFLRTSGFSAPQPSAPQPSAPRSTAGGSLARTVRARVALVAGGVALLAGCAPTISTTAGQYATSPECARVVLSLPDTVLDQQRAKVTAQATAAWGEPGAAITFTCGVGDPDPASDQCQSMTLNVFGKEEVFDWILIESEQGLSYVSYGRSPAMLVQIPYSLGTTQPTAALTDIALAVSHIEAEKACR